MPRLCLALLCALVLCAGQAEAQAPLPDYDSCTFTWQITSYNVYLQPSPTGPYTKAGEVIIPATGPLSFPCPTAQGTYYMSLRAVTIQGVEAWPNGQSTGITIKSPPPLVLAIGGQAQVVTALLNVRPAPTTVNSCVKCPTVAKGVIGTILDGPISADGFVWWKLSWGGWSAAAKGATPYLQPVPPLAPAAAILVPNPNAHK